MNDAVIGTLLGLLTTAICWAIGFLIAYKLIKRAVRIGVLEALAIYKKNKE